MFCPNCGKELPDGSKFCGFCGADIAKELKGGSSVAGENTVSNAGTIASASVADTGAGSYAGTTDNQSLGGYDPLGNGQGMNQAADNQYQGQTGGSQFDNSQYGGAQFDGSQYGGAQFNNSQYGGQFANNQYYNPNQQYANNQQYGAPNQGMQYGGYNGNIQQKAQPAGKSKKGIIAAIVSVILVLVIGGSAAAYHFITADKAKDKDDDDDKEVATSASTDDDTSAAATTAATDEEKEISGEEALELACDNLSKAKDYTSEFSYEMIFDVEASDEGISGDITEKGDFVIVTDFDVDTDDPDANILEIAEGTVTRDILGTQTSEDIIVSRGDFSGEFITSIEYSSGDRFEAGESQTIDTVLGFTDYGLYNAELQDKTKDIDGTECYVYISEGTYDQGGISSVYTPVTGIYNGDTDLCTVTIYVSKKDAQIVQVDTEYTESDASPLADSINEYTGADDIEFVFNTLTYSLKFTGFDTGTSPDPDFESLTASSSNTNLSFELYKKGILEAGDFGGTGSDDDFTNTDDDVTQNDDTEYVEDSFGALTYEVPEDWEGTEMDFGGYSGYVYVPDANETTVLLVMYQDIDMSSLSDSQKKAAIHESVLTLCDSYDLSSDDIKKGTVNGGYAENVRGTITESGTSLDMDVMVFETNGTGLGVVIYASEDIENSQYLAQYYHLLESLEF